MYTFFRSNGKKAHSSSNTANKKSKRIDSCKTNENEPAIYQNLNQNPNGNESKSLTIAIESAAAVNVHKSEQQSEDNTLEERICKLQKETIYPYAIWSSVVTQLNGCGIDVADEFQLSTQDLFGPIPSTSSSLVDDYSAVSAEAHAIALVDEQELADAKELEHILQLRNEYQQKRELKEKASQMSKYAWQKSVSLTSSATLAIVSASNSLFHKIEQYKQEREHSNEEQAQPQPQPQPRQPRQPPNEEHKAVDGHNDGENDKDIHNNNDIGLYSNEGIVDAENNDSNDNNECDERKRNDIIDTVNEKPNSNLSTNSSASIIVKSDTNEKNGSERKFSVTVSPWTSVSTGNKNKVQNNKPTAAKPITDNDNDQEKNIVLEFESTEEPGATPTATATATPTPTAVGSVATQATSIAKNTASFAFSKGKHLWKSRKSLFGSSSSSTTKGGNDAQSQQQNGEQDVLYTGSEVNAEHQSQPSNNTTNTHNINDSNSVLVHRNKNKSAQIPNFFA